MTSESPGSNIKQTHTHMDTVAGENFLFRFICVYCFGPKVRYIEVAVDEDCLKREEQVLKGVKDDSDSINTVVWVSNVCAAMATTTTVPNAIRLGLCKLFYRHKCSTITIIPLIILFIRGQFSLVAFCCCCFFQLVLFFRWCRSFGRFVCFLSFWLYEKNIFRFYTLYNVFNVRVYHTTTTFHIKCSLGNVIGRGFLLFHSIVAPMLSTCVLGSVQYTYVWVYEYLSVFVFYEKTSEKKTRKNLSFPETSIKREETAL